MEGEGSNREVAVESATPEALKRYRDLLSSVFDQVDPKALERGLDRLGPTTRFYSIGDSNSYASVLFVIPVTLAGVQMSGIGGVCTRQTSRGLGYGRRVLERAIEDMSADGLATLLWTRIPDYFARFGFLERSGLFFSDADGSSPMILFPDERVRLAFDRLRGLPRDYF